MRTSLLNVSRIRRKRESSKYRGVSHTRSGTYKAQLCINGDILYLGTFEFELEAAIAHDKASEQYFHEHAKLNFAKESRLDVIDSIHHLKELKKEFE